jgi:FemAB-related protein (PEP-CTERM system-associated)
VSPGALRVEECRFAAGEERAWDDYALRCGSARYVHRYGWARVIERTYRHRPIYLWAWDGQQVRGILPLVLFRGALGGRSLISLPFLDEGGVCADSPEAATALWESALETARRERAPSIELRERDPSGLPLAPVGSKVTLVLDLAGSSEVMWKKLDGKVRNQVRKALSSGLTTEWSGVEALDGFYAMFAENMRDLGSPVHDRRFFATILEEFADTARLLLVRDGSRTVAGGVCVFFGDTVIVPWASSLRKWRSRCPGNLLYWEVIRSACDKGLRRLDFGRSSPGSGTYQFKKQWGAVDRPLHWEHFSPVARGVSVVDPHDPRYNWMIRVWQRLPVPVATTIGPLIRKWVSN